jgi:SAM-dependent methyltransferase
VKKSVVNKRKDCRLCESTHLELALPMRPSPIGDAYITQDQLSVVQDSYPLSLYLCHDCGHLQLPDIVDPEILFGNYIYLTSTSPGLVDHFKKYADDVMQLVQCQKNSLVVEIGSNDGSLLKFFKNHGMKVLGVDPAKEIARQATESGVETIPTFFTLDVAKSIKQHHGAASIMTANNVFAHADNMNEIVEGIKYLLAPDGVFVFEVSYLVDMIEKNVFDTIYHEHLCHHRIEPLEKLFNRHGMCLFNVERISTKGGSIRGFAKHIHSTRNVSSVVNNLMQLEQILGLDKVAVYQNFSKHLEAIKIELNKVLDDMKAQGKSIAGYGASTPMTTTMYQFELCPYFDFIADDNAIKQGRFSPGYHLPVLPSSAIYEKNPDCIVILAWQYADLIIKKHQRFLEQGGVFVVPLPKVKVITESNTKKSSKKAELQQAV